MKPYVEFREAIKKRESSGRYGRIRLRILRIVNPWGYLGAYQFGMARLFDLGLTRRKVGRKGMANSDFEFIPPLTREGFLGNPQLQDHTFNRHVADLRAKIRQFYAGENISGAIAAAHLKGVGGLRAYVVDKRDSADALGTRVSDYFEKFRGYEIP